MEDRIALIVIIIVITTIIIIIVIISYGGGQQSHLGPQSLPPLWLRWADGSAVPSRPKRSSTELDRGGACGNSVTFETESSFGRRGAEAGLTATGSQGKEASQRPAPACRTNGGRYRQCARDAQGRNIMACL